MARRSPKEPRPRSSAIRASSKPILDEVLPPALKQPPSLPDPQGDPMPMLEVKDIHTYYGIIHALKGVSLTVEQGEIVTLIGANGAGKTTTLRSICGLQKPRTGSILL